MRTALSLGLAVATVLITAPFATSQTRAADTNITWNGITLGMPASELRAKFGDPLRIMAPGAGDERIARYWLPGQSSEFFLVMEQRGYVVGFDAFTESQPSAPITTVPADPDGVRIGDTIEQAQETNATLHSDTGNDGEPELIGRSSVPYVGMLYDFNSARVREFLWSMRLSSQLPTLAKLSEPPGDSEASALIDLQPSEDYGVKWEYLYLGYHPCDGNATWQLQQQSLIKDNGRPYDVLHVVCPTTKVARDFYFDISSFFGKL
jgi:hypothetical protein